MMEGPKNQKLTRTPSSLLRSPTVKSSINGLSILEEQAEDSYKKTHKFISPKRPGFLLIVVTISAPLLWFYLRSIPSQVENFPIMAIWLDLASVLLLFFGFALWVRRGIAGSTLGLRRLSVPFLKQLVLHLYEERHRKLGFRKGSSVAWYIGEEKSELRDRRKLIIREGVEVYSNGDMYEGEFHQGRSSGSGVYYYFGSGRYEGDWIDGKYDGYGIETWARGSRYRGQYRQGMRHGYGVYRFYTGDSYAGEWCNGQSHGCGVQSCEDGSRYVGEFKCGVKHGYGYYQFRNGDTYSGEYFADKPHGFGVYRFANGHCYEGSWHEGKKQGFGVYSFRSGDTRSGEWDNGALKNPHPSASLVVSNAVQEARKTAEKAFSVPRVEDRVNRAVVAASRAATAARVAAIKAVQNRIHGRFCDTDV
ncbi:MORN repeat-containing protein 1 [Amborella trichopoda]|nr:MORN repeat-containing protein 1 [Amborella trichopoda]|eukprot:XP_006845934.2 MORN repeat-containing protein 1 [Amborella trichopoda]